MKKIAVIGDSHAAMLNLALKEKLIESEFFEFQFFVWRSNGTKELEIKGKDQTKTIETIKILQKENHIINVELFDAFLLCGLGFSFRSIIEIYKTHRHDLQKSGAYIISESCWDSAAYGIVRQSLANEVVDKLHSITNKNIYLFPTPFASEHFLDSEEQKNLYKICIENGDDDDLSQRFEKVKKFWQDKDVKVINQPKETIRRSILTAANLSNAHPDVDNVKYLATRGKRDLTHMKPKFGAIMLEEFFRKFENIAS